MKIKDKLSIRKRKSADESKSVFDVANFIYDGLFIHSKNEMKGVKKCILL